MRPQLSDVLKSMIYYNNITIDVPIPTLLQCEIFITYT